MGDGLTAGHVSIQTTERYLGCKQRIRDAVNDKLGIERSRFYVRIADKPSYLTE